MKERHDEHDHYCTHCGSEDLAYGELRASGRELTCRQCGNMFQRDDERYDDTPSEGRAMPDLRQASAPGDGKDDGGRLMDYGTQALWPQMISALAAIDDALGLPQDGCNSTARTLQAIRKLRNENYHLRASLTDTLDFLERHSNRWDGVSGKHPADVAETARALLGPCQKRTRGKQ